MNGVSNGHRCSIASSEGAARSGPLEDHHTQQTLPHVPARRVHAVPFWRSLYRLQTAPRGPIETRRIPLAYRLLLIPQEVVTHWMACGFVTFLFFC